MFHTLSLNFFLYLLDGEEWLRPEGCCLFSFCLRYMARLHRNMDENHATVTEPDADDLLSVTEPEIQ